MNSGTDLARDIETGFLNRLALTPLRGAALLSGLLAGAFVLGARPGGRLPRASGCSPAPNSPPAPAGALVHRRPLGHDHRRLRHDRPLRRPAHRLRRGGPGPLPGLLRLPLPLLDGAAARPDDQTDWFHAIASVNPVSYLLEAFRSLLIEGWNLGELALGFGDRGGDLRDRDGGREQRPEDEAGADVSDAAATRRPPPRSPARSPGAASTTSSPTRPSWSRRCSSRSSSSSPSPAASRRSANVPGFDFPSGYTAFQFVFVLLQSAAFGGVFTGFAIARDFETGFGRRYMLAAGHRSGIVAGYALAALCPRLRHLDGADRGRADRRDGDRRQRRRTRRPLRARGPRQRRGDDVGGRAWRCGSARSRAGR